MVYENFTSPVGVNCHSINCDLTDYERLKGIATNKQLDMEKARPGCFIKHFPATGLNTQLQTDLWYRVFSVCIQHAFKASNISITKAKNPQPNLESSAQITLEHVFNNYLSQCLWTATSVMYYHCHLKRPAFLRRQQVSTWNLVPNDACHIVPTTFQISFSSRAKVT